MDAFSSFRDVLASEMSTALPELKEDIKMVVDSTGGKWDELAMKGEQEIKAEGGA